MKAILNRYRASPQNMDDVGVGFPFIFFCFSSTLNTCVFHVISNLKTTSFVHSNEMKSDFQYYSVD